MYQKVGAPMKRLLINMRNCLFADSIEQALKRENIDFETYRVNEPDEVIQTNAWFMPYAVLMEVARIPQFTVSERIRIAEKVKEENPECKIILIVDENTDKEVADDVRQTKKDGLIDEFIFTSISSSYLVAILDAV